jgi:hypothetical protein
MAFPHSKILARTNIFYRPPLLVWRIRTCGRTGKLGLISPQSMCDTGVTGGAFSLEGEERGEGEERRRGREERGEGEEKRGEGG